MSQPNQTANLLLLMIKTEMRVIFEHIFKSFAVMSAKILGDLPVRFKILHEAEIELRKLGFFDVYRLAKITTESEWLG